MEKNRTLSQGNQRPQKSKTGTQITYAQAIDQTNHVEPKDNKDNKILREILKSLEELNKKVDEQKETNKKIFNRLKKLETGINKVTRKQNK